MNNENKNIENETLAMTLVKEYAIQNKRITFVLLISIIINVIIVGLFIMYNLQYDYTGYDVTQDSQGINNYIGGDGSINGTENKEKNEDQERQESSWNENENEG